MSLSLQGLSLCFIAEHQSSTLLSHSKKVYYMHLILFSSFIN